MLTNNTERFKPFWEGRLFPESKDELDNFYREVGSATKASKDFSLKNLPQIELGEFEIEPLINFLPKDKSQDKAKDRTDDFEYYVMQFPVNFYPDDFVLDDVKFAVSFTTDTEKPKVADLYPREQVEEIKKNVSLSISPSLTFSDISVDAFDLSFSFTYDEIRPVIFGAGIGRPHAYWNMKKSISYFIAGAKVMHVILKVPKKAKVLTVHAELQAALLLGRNRFINTILGKEGVASNLSMDFNIKTGQPIVNN